MKRATILTSITLSSTILAGACLPLFGAQDQPVQIQVVAKASKETRDSLRTALANRSQKVKEAKEEAQDDQQAEDEMLQTEDAEPELNESQPIQQEAVETIQTEQESEVFTTSTSRPVSMIDLNTPVSIMTIASLDSASASIASEIKNRIQNGERDIRLSQNVDLAGVDASAFFNQLSLAIRNDLFPRSASLEARYQLWNNRMDYLNLFSGYVINGTILTAVSVNPESYDYFVSAEADAAAIDMEAVLNSLTAGITASTTEQEAFDLISTRVMNSFEYDTAYTGATIARCLLSGRGVCEGYARLLKAALQRVGISCSYVEGQAGTLHAWNQVSLDDQLYWSDLTWTDQLHSDQYRLSQTLWSDHTVSSMN